MQYNKSRGKVFCLRLPCGFVAGKAQQLIQGLTATGDEGQQLSAVIELCQVCQLFISAVKCRHCYLLLL